MQRFSRRLGGEKHCSISPPVRQPDGSPSSSLFSPPSARPSQVSPENSPISKLSLAPRLGASAVKKHCSTSPLIRQPDGSPRSHSSPPLCAALQPRNSPISKLSLSPRLGASAVKKHPSS